VTTTRKLEKHDDRSSFTCGDDDLDRFFQRQAGQHQFNRLASVTYVAIEDETIAGFVTVCPGTLTRGDLGPAFKNYPPFPLPVLLLARLGVSTTMRGQGVGELLLRHALTLAMGLTDTVGCVGVVVDAKADSLAFYEKYGFTQITMAPPGRYPRLFLSITALPGANRRES
jgi:GNAT superfamily N-acetyltransferase